MAKCFHLRVQTPGGIVLEGQAEYCSLPIPDGSVGILADQGCVVALSRQRSAAEQQHACQDEQAERD
jgi:F0F1-type ATP synthase epsilon subunit